MEKFETICENREFRRIYARGKAYVSPVVVVYTMKNRSHQLRVGITTTKKIGNAVKRSRCRRVIREAVRALAPEIPSGWSLVLVARVKTSFVKSTQVEREMRACLKKAGLLPGKKDMPSAGKSGDGGGSGAAGEERKETPPENAAEE